MRKIERLCRLLIYLAENHQVYSVDQLKNAFDNQQLLIILIGRLYFGKAGRDDVEQFIGQHTIDEQQFFRLACLHGIASLMYYIINEHNLSISQDTKALLRHQYMTNQMRCMEQLVIASRMQQSLLQQNIEVIPYKGIAFSHNYYGNIGLRESSDIDFLINENDADAIEDYMIREGYRPKNTVPATYRKYYRKHFKDISYSVPAKSKSDGYSAEMHWRLLNAHYGAYVSYDFFKKGLQHHNVGQFPFASLQPHYDLLAVGSNHFVKDLAIRFKYIIDIACLLHAKGNEIDATEFRSVIQRFGFEKRMEHGLFLVETLLGQSIPGFDPVHRFDANVFHHTLECRLIKIKISNPSFIKRTLHLLDSNADKMRFLLRCMYNYTLPMASDIPPGNKRPIPLLMLMRLYRSAGKMFGHSPKSQE